MAALASADPVRLTSGNIQADDDLIGSFSLFGNAFAAEGSGLGAPIVDSSLSGPVDFSGGFRLFAVNDTNIGELTSGGETRRGFLTASFQVAGQSDRHPGHGPGTAGVHHTVQRTRRGAAFDAVRSGGNLLFTQDVIGTGTLSVNADNIGENGRFFTRSMALRFSPAVSPSPTPEPGSLLLFGTGLIAAWQSHRFRRAE